MKKAATGVFTVLAIIIMLIMANSLSIRKVKAATDESALYIVEHVAHTVNVLYNGYIFINDTIQIKGNASSGTMLSNFLIGFPHKYGSYVLYGIAYDASTIFNVTLNAPLENRIGFYMGEIIFQQPLDISNGTDHVFTIGFILSNNLVQALGANNYFLDFPAYPTLTNPAINCSVKINLPKDSTEIIIKKDDGNLINASAYSKTPLPAFTHSPANLSFTISTDKMPLLDIRELKREVKITDLGEIEVSDTYSVSSKSSADISFIEVRLPPNASKPSAHDQFGRKVEKGSGWSDEKKKIYKAALASPLESNKSTIFTVKYFLPTQSYIKDIEGTRRLNLTEFLFPAINYYVEQATVIIVLPEGARILSMEKPLICSIGSMKRNVFQETITLNNRYVSYLENALPLESTPQVVFDYNPLWLSFRPALWTWALTIIGCAVAIAWRRPKAPPKVPVPTVAIRLRPEQIKSFIDAYEEKRKITLELDSLEAKVQRGKIPRRRYKVQKRTLEIRLSTLSRNLAELKEKMRAASGAYADFMRQLEIAETEINEVEANIKSIEARHNRGELSLEAYRKLLADYQHRKEKAGTVIDGILLRLREETR